MYEKGEGRGQKATKSGLHTLWIEDGPFNSGQYKCVTQFDFFAIIFFDRRQPSSKKHDPVLLCTICINA